MNPIECIGVGKRYLRISGANFLAHKITSRQFRESDWLQALDDINLDISHPGKRIGIIGANGSGKTTLLRILAGVTKPSQGTVAVNGRVAPLLEPVAGMQPDLTGKENIYLVGIILGMRRHEIREKFNEIVAFAGIHEFLDMPLKHYSLGMIMRLGFSVAIHVDANIILVDEAWSIGDAQFQAKSLERLRQLHEHQATIILVSHDLEIIRQQTDETLWLQGGRVAEFGPTHQIVDSYLKDVKSGLVSEENLLS